MLFHEFSLCFIRSRVFNKRPINVAFKSIFSVNKMVVVVDIMRCPLICVYNDHVYVLRVGKAHKRQPSEGDFLSIDFVRFLFSFFHVSILGTQRRLLKEIVGPSLS